jgi:hypothetical protein
MKFHFLFPFVFFLCGDLTAQLIDDFSDGDLSSNPEWLGNPELFVITDGELQLNDLSPGSSNTAYLYTAAPTSTDAATTWEFFVRLEFAPSASNFARVYLAASNPDLNGDQQGYFVRIGGIAGDNDALELFRQDGASSTSLISGMPGAVAGDPAVASVRVTRSASGEWELWADYSGGNDYQLQGTAIDDTFSAGNYFGFFCRYSSTRGQSFFFDNVLVDPLYVDLAPPQLVAVEALSATELLVRFDEPLDPATASTPSNYQVSDGIGQPMSAILDVDSPFLVRLQLSNPLQNLAVYELTVTGIADAAGNAGTEQTASFIFYNIQLAEPGDIIINEIMADPNPPVDLPAAEYVELYNRSDKVIQMQGFGFSAGAAPQLLPARLLLPGGYLILCDDSFEADFSVFGDVAPLATFPALVNAGDDLTLFDPFGEPVHEVTYSSSWYQDTEKAEGGWSLELIDPEIPASCSGNWRASDDPLGGTPGRSNSLLGTSPDTQGPELVKAIALNEFEVALTFSKPLEESPAANPELYAIDNGIAVMEAFLMEPSFSEVLLLLSSPLQPGVAYTITASSDISDCLGNKLQGAAVLTFGLAEPIDPGDLAINEILFNPETGGSDFLELYNRSNKIFNLAGLEIVNEQKLTGARSAVFSHDRLLFPGEYIAVTENPDDIMIRYYVREPAALVYNRLPAFDDKSGNVTIRRDEITIDSFDYLESMHNALLDIKDGVSLERIDPAGPTQSSGNWHSAATTAGSATPTYRNSQFFAIPSMIDRIISIPRNTFSPDDDGFEDVLLINYAAGQPGYALSISVFDAQGRLVRKLLRNELLASEGNFKWDGETEEGRKARIGIYIVWIELFHADGRVERRKETCVLAGKLE